MVKITSPDNYSVSFDYDNGNHVVKAYDEEGNSVKKTVDLSGKPRSVTDPNGNIVARYDYYASSKDGRLKQIFRAGGDSTLYDYDANGNVVSVTHVPTDGSADLVVTMGTPVRSDYQFDMTNIKQGVAVSSPNDSIQTNGGNAHSIWAIGEFGDAGRERNEPGFINISLSQLNGHSDYWQNPSVTIGAVDNAIKGSSQQNTTPTLTPYSAGGSWSLLPPKFKY